MTIKIKDKYGLRQRLKTYKGLNDKGMALNFCEDGSWVFAHKAFKTFQIEDFEEHKEITKYFNFIEDGLNKIGGEI